MTHISNDDDDDDKDFRPIKRSVYFKSPPPPMPKVKVATSTSDALDLSVVIIDDSPGTSAPVEEEPPRTAPPSESKACTLCGEVIATAKGYDRHFRACLRSRYESKPASQLHTDSPPTTDG